MADQNLLIRYEEIENDISKYSSAAHAMEDDMSWLIQQLAAHTETFQGPYKQPFDDFSALLQRSHDQLTSDLTSGAAALQNIADALHEGDAAATRAFAH